MSLLTLIPNGAGALAQHQRSTGSSNWSLMTSNDGDTTYVYNLTDGSNMSQMATDLYAMGNSGGQIGVIDQLQVNVRARYRFLDPGGVAQVNPLLRLGSVNYGSGFFNLTSSYATYSYTRTTHPGTGLPFTWANVDAHQAGFSSLAGDSGIAFTEVRATYVWSVVTFHLVLRPSGPAVIGVAAQQPELRLHLVLRPGGPAVVGVAVQQPELRLHLILTPEGAAIVPVTVQDAALLIGLAPARDPRAVFDLRLRGTGELALSLSRAHTLFLELRRAGVIEEDGS